MSSLLEFMSAKVTRVYSAYMSVLMENTHHTRFCHNSSLTVCLCLLLVYLSANMHNKTKDLL